MIVRDNVGYRNVLIRTNERSRKISWKIQTGK